MERVEALRQGKCGVRCVSFALDRGQGASRLAKQASTEPEPEESERPESAASSLRQGGKDKFKKAVHLMNVLNAFKIKDVTSKIRVRSPDSNGYVSVLMSAEIRLLGLALLHSRHPCIWFSNDELGLQMRTERIFRDESEEESVVEDSAPVAKVSVIAKAHLARKHGQKCMLISLIRLGISLCD